MVGWPHQPFYWQLVSYRYIDPFVYFSINIFFYSIKKYIILVFDKACLTA